MLFEENVIEPEDIAPMISNSLMLFETPNDFSMYIETMSANRSLGIMDAILAYCEENALEPEDIAPMISKSLKNKLESNFIELNYLPRTATLEI